MKTVIGCNPKTAEPIAPGNNLRRYIEHQGDEGWFSFEADGASTDRLHLHGLPADYDIALYDKQKRG